MSRVKNGKNERSRSPSFPPCHHAVFSPHLAPDADSQRLEGMNRFVVAGKKIDDLALMLIRAFFSLKNRVDKDLGKSHDALLLGFLA